ncbi:hypothetical protein MY10362_009589, partial [Beauveria mimosiformis]
MTSTDSASALRTYRGNCHCGAFVYEAELPEITAASECPCSICRKKGYLFAGTNSKTHFKVVKGSLESLSEYTFGTKALRHKFCSHCGTAVLATVPTVQAPGKDIYLNNAYLWVYPKTEQVVLSGKEEDIARYSFNHEVLAKPFCRTCGVSMSNPVNAQTTADEAAARMPGADAAQRDKVRSIMARHSTLHLVNVADAARRGPEQAAREEVGRGKVVGAAVREF